VIDIVEILAHWHTGRPKAEIAHSLGVDRKTVRKYVAAAQAAGITPGGEPLGGEPLGRERWAAHVREWFPELVDPELRCPSFAELARFHEAIKAGLETNTASTVWQRLRDEQGLGASLASFRRYIHARLPEEANRSAVTVRKDDPPPGEEAQIDYGYLGCWSDASTGRARRVWAFVMVLAACRHMFVLPVLAMTLQAWVDAHVAAFSFFGGTPRRLVYEYVARHIFVAHPGGHTGKVREAEHMPLEERLGRLVGERHRERSARARQPHMKQPQPQQHAVDPSVELSRCSTSASAPGACSCTIDTSRSRCSSSARISATRARTVDSATWASHSVTSRCQIRRAVCRCFGRTCKSSVNHRRIVASCSPNAGDKRSGVFRGRGVADANASRTRRRCTP